MKKLTFKKTTKPLMKKRIALLSIFLLIFTSCTKDDENLQNQDNAILPIKIISTYNTDTETSIYTYNGNKINEVTNNDGNKSVYTYSENLISKITEYEGTKINSTDDFTYENGKLKSVLTVENYTNSTTGILTTYKSRTVYTHNSNGTILEESYDIDPKTAVETKNEDTATYTFVNGNLMKVVYFSSYKDATNTLTYEYEYDDKKNPLLNIIGLDKIELKVISKNNVLKQTRSDQSTSYGITVPGLPTETTNYTNIYNSNNFLSESKFTYTSGTTIKPANIQYFYE